VGEARRLALACGVEHILTKASEPEDVLAKVEEVLAGGFPLPPGRGAAGESAHLDHLRVLSAKLYDKVSELERVNEDRQRLEGRLRELLDRMITAQEEERRRIAADIHDDTIQVMGAVSARLHRLWARASDETQLQLVSDVEETVRLAIGRLRALIFDLRPPALDFRGGLAGALREYLEKTPADSQLPFSVQGDVQSATRTETQLILYRIAQEALINVRKHARASRVDVEIEEVDAGVRVRVRDDGVGFDPSRLESVPGHLGVTAMRERAELEGGWWCCASAPGEGTLVEFWVPL
jgi:signal transduction histidine kinase